MELWWQILMGYVELTCQQCDPITKILKLHKMGYTATNVAVTKKVISATEDK